MKIELELTEAEAKAMSFVCADIKEWAQNALSNRARIAMQEVFDREVARMVSDPTTNAIPASIEEVVLRAQIQQTQPEPLV